MLGQTLVTKQTGPAGKPVNVLYIASKMSLAREMYFALLLDRATAGADLHLRPVPQEDVVADSPCEQYRLQYTRAQDDSAASDSCRIAPSQAIILCCCITAVELASLLLSHT